MTFTCDILTNVLVLLMAPTSAHSQVLKINNSCGTARGSYLKIAFSCATLNFFSFIPSVAGMVLSPMQHSGMMHAHMIYQFLLENIFWLMLALEHLTHYLFPIVVSVIISKNGGRPTSGMSSTIFTTSSLRSLLTMNLAALRIQKSYLIFDMQDYAT